MRILQIGAGSMGTRRIRDLSRRPGVEITLVDQRLDRQVRALERFGVASVESVVEGLAEEPDAVVISTPPDRHADLVTLALDHGLHFFCEADIWSQDPDRIEAATAPGQVAAPSCTLRFHPFVTELRRVVAEDLGTVHAFGYVLSVDAASWHPGEGAEYYARHRPTAPAREMVPFELIALEHVFGPAVAVSGRVARRGQLDLYAEDTWSMQMELAGGATGALTVAMASPAPVRQGWAVGDHGFLRFDLLAGTIEHAGPGSRHPGPRLVCDWTANYEPMYDAEMSAFLAAVAGQAPWPYPYRAAAMVCGTLAAAELSMLTGRVERVDPARQPAFLPDGYPLPERVTSAG